MSNLSSRVNKKVQISRPRVARLDRRRTINSELEKSALGSTSDGKLDLKQEDMLLLWGSFYSMGKEIEQVAETRLKGVCYPIGDDDIELRKAVAYLHTYNAITNNKPITNYVNLENVSTESASELPSTESTPGDFSVLAQNEMTKHFGGIVNSHAEAADLAPMTYSSIVIKNLPTRICGEDFILAEKLFQNSVLATVVESDTPAVAPLKETKGELDPKHYPLTNYQFIAAILLMWLLEFGLLFIIKNFALQIFKGPLSFVGRLIRNLCLRLLRKASNWIMKSILLDDDNEKKDEIRKLQVQKILLFAGNNPFLFIAQNLGII